MDTIRHHNSPVEYKYPFSLGFLTQIREEKSRSHHSPHVTDSETAGHK